MLTVVRRETVLLNSQLWAPKQVQWPLNAKDELQTSSLTWRELWVSYPPLKDILCVQSAHQLQMAEWLREHKIKLTRQGCHLYYKPHKGATAPTARTSSRAPVTGDKTQSHLQEPQKSNTETTAACCLPSSYTVPDERVSHTQALWLGCADSPQRVRQTRPYSGEL